ncbi:MAG: TAXI family TRAP transporter solute-binding subunit, partial [Planctomycetes bacterium]|nr:TAXI family TRAP transporter solute-binding subunit [Planctomycetota bacterium]
MGQNRLRSDILRMKLNQAIMAAVLLLTLLPSVTFAEKITIRLATGSRTGVYFPLGHGIKKAVEDTFPDILIEVVETSGTLDNLRLLDNEQVDMALVQNDSAYYFSHGEAMFNLPSSKALAVASLYTEIIQVIATKKSNIQYLNQLKGRRVRTGSPPDNIANSATLMFSLDGWEATDLTDIRCKFGEARDMLFDNSLDAAFVTAGIPTPLLTTRIDGISLLDYVNFVPINEGLANRLIRRFPYFVYTEIPGNTYDFQDKAVKTVGVRAILVARKDFEQALIQGKEVPPNFIRSLTRIIFEQSDVITQDHGVPGVDLSKYQFSLSQGLDGILDHRMQPIIPVHPQSWAFYMENGLLKKDFFDHLPTIVWSCLLVVIAGYVIKYRAVIRYIMQRHMHLKLFVIFVFLFILGTLAMYFCERYNNTSFETLGESFWSITIYMLSGFEDRYPVTWPGRVISILIFILSVFFFGAVAGRFAAAFLRREEIKMPRDVSNHIVICNWNERGKRIVAELRHPEGKPDAEIIIIDDKLLNEEELLNTTSFRKIHCIHKDPSRHGTLRAARVKSADTIIILSDDQTPDPDAKSAMIILALLRECKNKKPHIITEVVNSENSQHLQDAGANETICTTDVGIGILAHCAVNKQLSDVYKDLLTYTFEGNELYIIPRERFPDSFVGKTFSECAQIID